MLAEIERRIEADDPRFTAGFVSLRPCPPREYRSRTRRRAAVWAGCIAVVSGVGLVMWLWLGWFVAAMFGLESVVMGVLMALDRNPDPEASAI
ncbi:DUF3040 domain-containing protein [Dactylosporangium aurantiacum]|uniref:DUF3040 domain-containing protein n=1 Tax=Dactylosporangium aurantiacum TaxID=35754 RepID=A0A9Q9IAW8_9ACTN|nr:DUF3040 domain-containing protein [Dactylosporangium aurantiacum]MDG6110481.1 DUF3040 domain-containing protein [Dactylosporangium aurantiacum]UWZ51035.1 DUF3040 domain-containing protein [Dactylosporangium aurantiacum]